MSKSKHRQSAVQWNPPKLPADVQLPISCGPRAASATDCTGLAAVPAQNEGECGSLAELEAVLPHKPQGNIGKGNPRNDPDEIRFHRGEENPKEH